MTLLVPGAALSAACDDTEAALTTGTGGQATAGSAGNKAGSAGSAQAGTSGKAGSGGAGAGGAGAGGAGAGGKAGSGGAGAGGAGAGGKAGSGGAGAGGAGAGGKAGSGGVAGTGGTAGGGAGGASGTGGGGAGGAKACEVTTGDGTVATNVKLATGGVDFMSPLDAAPSPDGKTVYFTALTPAGDAAVFSVKDDGTALTKLASGGKLVSPTGIAVSVDGATLYIADPGATEDPASSDPTKDAGLFFSLPATGGTPAVLVSGKWPKAVAVGTSGTACTESVFFCGVDSAGVTNVYDKAGAVALTGAALTDCSGLTVGTDGTIFAVAAVSATHRGAVVSGKSGGAPATLIDGLTVGYPSGIAVSPDGTNLVVSGLSKATSSDVVLKIKLADKSATEQAPLTDPLVEAGGLHRALSANVYAFVDGLGANGKGSVWLVKP